jgi:putative membrane protein
MTPAASPGGDRPLDLGTQLAIERTSLAAERTLMAWIRTAFSMISFGFTIGKFLEYLRDKDTLHSIPEHGGWLPRILVLLGLFSLVVGAIAYRRERKHLGGLLHQVYHVSAVGLIAVAVAMIGMLVFVSLFIHLDFL